MTQALSTIEIRNQGDSADVLIYGEIGGDPLWTPEATGAKDFVDKIGALQVATLNVFINSPGGTMAAGLAMHNALTRHPARKIVTIDGIAASAASFVAMAGDEIRMPENTLMMMHNASDFCCGTSDDMRRAADVLDKANETIAGVYATRSKLPLNDVLALMSAETWLSATEAKAKGLCDSVLPAKQTMNCAIPPGRFRNVPDAIKNAAPEGVDKPSPIPGDTKEPEMAKTVEPAEGKPEAGGSTPATLQELQTIEGITADCIVAYLDAGLTLEQSQKMWSSHVKEEVDEGEMPPDAMQNADDPANPPAKVPPIPPKDGVKNIVRPPASRKVRVPQTVSEKEEASEAPLDFTALVNKFKATGLTDDAAKSRAARENPDAHAAFIRNHNARFNHQVHGRFAEV